MAEVSGMREDDGRRRQYAPATLPSRFHSRCPAALEKHLSGCVRLRGRERRGDRSGRVRGKADDLCAIRQQEALFAAVVARKVRANTSIEYVATMGSTIEQRLEAIASVLLGRILSPESIGSMRAVVAEARRFPDLAISVKRQARDLGIESVARLLGEVAQSGEMGVWPAFAPDRLSGTARRFMDVIVFPMAMRALFGEDLDRLRAEIGSHFMQAVAFFLAACRHAPLASDGSGQLTVTKRAER
jgi:hypothetical protein